MLLFTLGMLGGGGAAFRTGAAADCAFGGADAGDEDIGRATANADAGKTRTGRTIVAMQMALCVVLLVGAGLLIRTLQNLENTPLGFSTDGLVVFGVKPEFQVAARRAGRSTAS